MIESAAAVLQADREAQLDDLLSRWHNWQQGAKIGRGHAHKTLVMGDNYLVSRQYDDQNGALDDSLDDRRSAAVNFEAEQMLDPWKAAIYVIARNLCTGYEVWQSPRIPQDRDVRAIVVRQARAQMMERLIAAGVVHSHGL